MMTANVASQASSSYRTRRETIGTMIKIAAYVRVSTDKQADSGLSLEAQESAIRRYCHERGYSVAEIFVDGGYSAKNTERPAFKRMVQAIRNGGIDAIVVTKLDRLTRSLRDICSINEDILEPYQVQLIAINDGINTFEAVSKTLLPFLAVIGQIERQNTSERVKASIRHIQDQGGHYGKVPFGYMTVQDGRIKRLVPNPAEKPWLDKLIAWYREGVRTSEIAKRLNQHSVKPRQAKEWSQAAVYELLRTINEHRPRNVQSEFVYDKLRAYKIAYDMRSDQRTLKIIVERLCAEGLRPKNAARYTVSSVQDLLRSAVYHNKATAHGLARHLREQGHSLRDIGTRLSEAGFAPKRGGQWHANTVKMLLLLGDKALSEPQSA